MFFLFIIFGITLNNMGFANTELPKSNSAQVKIIKSKSNSENLVINLTGGGDWQKTFMEFIQDGRHVNDFSQYLKPKEMRTYRGTSGFDENNKSGKLVVPYVYNRNAREGEEVPEEAKQILNQLQDFAIGMRKNPEQYCNKQNADLAVMSFKSPPDEYFPSIKERREEFQSQKIDGPSSLETFDKGLADLLSKSKQGDHLWIAINDHGTPDGKLTLATKISSEYPTAVYQSIIPSELKKKLTAFNQKGVFVHLSIDACYSGTYVQEFHSEVSADSKLGQTCVVANSDANNVSFGGFYEHYFQVQKKEGKEGWSQILGYENALMHDQLNIPYSSLDVILQDWEWARLQIAIDKSTRKYSSSCMIPKNNNLTLDVQIPNSLRDKLRSHLNRILKVSKEDCSKSLAKTELGSQGSEQILSRQKNIIAYISCFESIAKDLNLDCDGQAFPKTGMCTWIDTANKHLLKSTINPLQVKCKHLEFVDQASEMFLAKYKSALCCLEYDGINKRSDSDLCL